MKKLLAALLAAVLLLGCFTALAEAYNYDVYYQELGLTLNIGPIINSCDNYVSMESDGVFSHDPYAAKARFLYYAIPREHIDALYASVSNSDEEDIVQEYLYSVCRPIGYLYVTDAPDADAMYRGIGIEMDGGYDAEEIAVDGNWHYYYVKESPSRFLEVYDDSDALGIDLSEAEIEAVKAHDLAEIDKINAQVAALVRDCEKTTPEDPSGELIGQTIQFETTDLDGNPVRSEDLFKDNKITVVNLWGSWCGGCVAELPSLAEAHERLKEKGCGVVGVDYEFQEPEVYKPKCERFLAEAGVTYPNVLRPDGNPIFSAVGGYPVSYLVDSEGRILTYPLDIWVDKDEEIIDKLLAGEAVDRLPGNNATPSAEDMYRVCVYDTDGRPVPDVIVQFCDDQTCTLRTTDANGVATFTPEAQKVYDVHVLKAPEGFRQDEKAYKTLENYSDVNIFLDRAE